MDPSDINHSQLTHPRTTYKRFKGSMIRLFQRLGCHDGTHGQEELIGGLHLQHPLDAVVGEQEMPRSVTTKKGTSGSHRLDGDHEDPETVVANPKIQEPHTHDAPHSRTTVLAGPHLMQSNAYFQNAHHFNILGNPSFQNQNISSITNIYGEATGIENLKGFVSFDAQFDSSAHDPRRRCHPGTREIILNRLRHWFDNPNSIERIFWLHGPAGAGKSAIAQTIAHSYNRPKVAATFFFFGSDVNRNDGKRLFTTLAYQLAFSMPAIKDYIANSLIERPDVPRTGVETQFQHLLVRPFQVLSNDATEQLAPAVHVVIDILRRYQALAPVIIIDGVDECSDENLQRRFLQVIGDAVTDDRFPLRFLIISRPELHIEQTIRHFQKTILSIDLAILDDANTDIEKYLTDEFSRLASEQGLDPTWPGLEIIREIVYKSSGNFIYPSVVIRFVSDPDNIAESQLDIVLNIKPSKITSPFAILDQLFLEILKRVPDQDFLKRYLALLVARTSLPDDYEDLDLHEDDPMLMHVSEKELHAKLRRMRSILIFKSPIDVHHKSFLDFLHDPSRSGEYYVNGGIRGYLEVLIHSLDRYIFTMIERPDHRNIPHFAPRLRAVIKDLPPRLQLSLDEWQEMTQLLTDLQDRLLQLPNFASALYILRCDECAATQMLRELLFLCFQFRRLQGQPNDTSIQSVMAVRHCKSVIPSTTTETEKNLDSVLLSLFSCLPETTENWSPTKEVIQFMDTILSFDCAETTMRIRFVSDAQKLVDLLAYLIDKQNTLGMTHPNTTRQATLLGLEIFSRVLIIPSVACLNGNHKQLIDPVLYGAIPIQVYSQTLIASRVLDRRYIVPLVAVKGDNGILGLASDNVDTNSLSMLRWRQTSNPSSATTIQIMLGIARALQYFHSTGIILYREFGSRDVFLDSDLRPKIRSLCSTSRLSLDKWWKRRLSIEDNIFCFGCLFYELLYNVDTKPSVPCEVRRGIVTKRPYVLEIPAYAWQLIQCCCAQDPKSRPTVDKVVQEMESWKIAW